jgi:hypothetical protein
LPKDERPIAPRPGAALHDPVLFFSEHAMTRIAIVLLALAASLPAHAQTAPRVERPERLEHAAPTPERERPARPDRAERPERRPLSEAQQRNVRIMRECGAEWRAAKESGHVEGVTWRMFLGTCRARKTV